MALLEIISDSRSPQLVQSSVDFDGFGTFAFDTTRHPQQTWGEYLGAEHAFRSADSQTTHDGTRPSTFISFMFVHLFSPRHSASEFASALGLPKTFFLR